MGWTPQTRRWEEKHKNVHKIRRETKKARQRNGQPFANVFNVYLFIFLLSCFVVLLFALHYCTPLEFVSRTVASSCYIFMCFYVFIHQSDSIQFNRYLCNPVALSVNSVRQLTTDCHLLLRKFPSQSSVTCALRIGTHCRLACAPKTANDIYVHRQWSCAIIIQYRIWV